MISTTTNTSPEGVHNTAGRGTASQSMEWRPGKTPLLSHPLPRYDKLSDLNVLTIQPWTDWTVSSTNAPFPPFSVIYFLLYLTELIYSNSPWYINESWGPIFLEGSHQQPNRFQIFLLHIFNSSSSHFSSWYYFILKCFSAPLLLRDHINSCLPVKIHLLEHN